MSRNVRIVFQAVDPVMEYDSRVYWVGVLTFEGIETGDRRYIEANALNWEMPTNAVTGAANGIPLRWMPADIGGHDGAIVVGLITSCTRMEDGAIYGEGFIDLSISAGFQVCCLMESGLVGGVSVDLDDVVVSPEDNGRLNIMSGRIRGATLVDIPAFADARIALRADMAGRNYRAEAQQALTAAAPLAAVREAIPVEPPVAWFDDPQLAGPTALTFTDEGRVYGHIATWGTCHTGYPGACVTPPRSAANYSWFRTGILTTSEGIEMPVGHITIGTGHAPHRMGAAPALAHYDNTGTVAADVAAGEDEHGIWVAGALRPNLSPEQIRELRSAPMSGDWRAVGGNLELMAVLGVNLPGFPVPRPQALVASGTTQTLIVPVNSQHEAGEMSV